MEHDYSIEPCILPVYAPWSPTVTEAELSQKVVYPNVPKYWDT